MSIKSKIITIIVTLLILAAAAFVYIKYYFVFGSGVKAGELNQIVYKGWVWKTYEGRLIMSGFKNDKKGAGLQSNEFTFSVDKKAEGRKANGAVYSVADSLMRCSGKMVQVKYKEYRGALPWRGIQKFVVFDILSVSDPIKMNTIPVAAEE